MIHAAGTAHSFGFGAWILALAELALAIVAMVALTTFWLKSRWHWLIGLLAVTSLLIIDVLLHWPAIWHVAERLQTGHPSTPG
ncbi:MAG: hypothetical protein ACKVP3_11715 [Hyphomicrobiaceae bacterium]